MVLPQIYLVPLVTIRPRQRGRATDLHRPGSLPHCYLSGLPVQVTTANVAAMFRALDVPARELHIRNNQPASSVIVVVWVALPIFFGRITDSYGLPRNHYAQFTDMSEAFA